MRALILIPIVLSACSSATTEPVATAPPASAPVTSRGEESSDSACSAVLIRRAGLETQTPECAEGITRFTELPSADLACSTDADCSVYMAAGGCLGVNVATAAHSRMVPLLMACIIGDSDCSDADFTDHRTACRGGCCVIYEE